MIRNVILHLQSELPMKADIEALPTAADAGLLCTNLRTLEGRKPMSTEFLDSVFLIPYNVIRFIEIPRVSIHESGLDQDLPAARPALPAAAGATPTDAGVLVTPAPAELEPADEEDEELEHLEVDAELLRRIREA
ncbi:MAG: hypothetical protein PVG27_13510 [Chloroflexota bacterium]|jgi:hypothetical protein